MNITKILLVDDDELMIDMYSEKFRNDGYTLAIAFNGEECIKKALSFQPDLILLDIMMPIMDGLTALRKLKEHPNTQKIPVILLTNVGGLYDDIKQGLSLGANEYIIKSHFTPKQVVEKVEEILKDKNIT
jgi:CheY-like chemotaxis protein